MNNITRYFENSESSSDDELFAEYVLMRRPKVFRPRNSPLDHWDDVDFLKRYRLSKETVAWIVEQIGVELQTSTTRNHAVLPLEQLLITLRFYATGNMQQCSGDLSGVSKSTVCKIIHEVSKQICVKLRHLISMPETDEEIREVVQKFYSIAKFPSVIGAIDCTHIRIASPGGDNAELYRNRKDVFTINTQAVVDGNLKIRNIVARWPGSVHDSTIFNSSAMKELMHSEQFGRCCLLGDRGYALKKFLLTPLANPQTPAERLYNESHIRTRNVVERTFGVWKRRSPCVGSKLRVKLCNVQAIIVSTAILHNICIDKNDILPEETTNPYYIMQEMEENIVIGSSTQSDQQYRQQLIDNYFSLLSHNEIKIKISTPT